MPDPFADEQEVRELTQTETYQKILSPIPHMLAGKNDDYDDSYVQARDELGPISLIVMLRHKFNRLKSLGLRKDRLPENESYLDTLRDIIGYCVLEIEYLEQLSQQRQAQKTSSSKPFYRINKEFAASSCPDLLQRRREPGHIIRVPIHDHPADGDLS